MMVLALRVVLRPSVVTFVVITSVVLVGALAFAMRCVLRRRRLHLCWRRAKAVSAKGDSRLAIHYLLVAERLWDLDNLMGGRERESRRLNELHHLWVDMSEMSVNSDYAQDCACLQSTIDSLIALFDDSSNFRCDGRSMHWTAAKEFVALMRQLERQREAARTRIAVAQGLHV